ncbi:group III truncated hemoglobin [Dyella agri]|uniref:Group III truncated hemoglobin n=1 Tax=Dyella agri TaxID=1926869 RepID=A0ABW8KN00_9GAMM
MSTLDETRIATLVERFYDKVRADASIGPIFNAAVHDWPEHKDLLTRFWCSVALGAQSYRGNPMAVHRGQPSIRAVHFARWLELWHETTNEVLDEDDAARMQDYADRIGRSLRMGMGLPERLDVRPLGIPIVGVGRC